MKPFEGMVQRTEGYEDEDEEEIRMKPLVQLKRMNGGGAASPELEQSIQRERGKGQPLAESIRQPLENAFGIDFGGVRVHTDNVANQLNESIQAKAFTTGQDVFFRQGAYAPESQGGQELLAHELTHVVQQTAPAIQQNPMQSTPANQMMVQGVFYVTGQDKYYSHALEAQEVTPNQGVISVVTTSDDFTGGHAIIYTEQVVEDGDDYRPVTKEIDLMPANEGDGVAINYVDASEDHKERLASNNRKKSWVVDNNTIEVAINKALALQGNQDRYTYEYVGISLNPKIHAINCARFVEKVLKAAGIGQSLAGTLFKIPKTLLEGEHVDYEPDEAYMAQKELYPALEGWYERVEFEAGKKMMGSRVFPGKLNTEFTFKAIPPGYNPFTPINEQELDEFGENDIRSDIRYLTPDINEGIANLQAPGGETIYVSLAELFDFNADPPTLITTRRKPRTTNFRIGGYRAE
ncbi:MAG: DUF4157 domain-containing protein [Spirulina sp. SIO3F2]|nr:DUF4157 domain-containing protein [Spirulina sp. SIO3F2]